ncbi:MaoC family dehydratase [soil metagenome]
MMGHFLEELRAGMEFDLGTYHFTRDNVLRFARTYDPQPFHTDDVAAEASHFGRLAASGWHTAAAWMSCFVATDARLRQEREARGETAARLGPSPGLRNLKWIKPVYPLDTIKYHLVVTSARPLATRTGWGMGTMSTDGMNQHGEHVFSFDGMVMVPRLPA